MLDFHIGQIVFSKMGRDKGLALIIMALEGDFAYLVDGKTRPLEKPKKKKLKHLQPTKYINHNLADIFVNNKYIKNSDIKEVIRAYLSPTVKGEDSNGERRCNRG